MNRNKHDLFKMTATCEWKQRTFETMFCAGRVTTQTGVTCKQVRRRHLRISFGIGQASDVLIPEDADDMRSGTSIYRPPKTTDTHTHAPCLRSSAKRQKRVSSYNKRQVKFGDTHKKTFDLNQLMTKKVEY